MSTGYSLTRLEPSVAMAAAWLQVNSGADAASVAAGSEPVLYDWLFWNSAFTSVRALVRFDCAERSLADPDTPRNVGMAMASRIAMISSTTISSIRVKPASAASPVSIPRVSRRRVSVDLSMDFLLDAQWLSL